MARVLVTDGEQRSSLAVVRSLGGAGHRVHVCAASESALAAASRYAESGTVCPSPLDSPESFCRSVERLVERLDVDLLLPMGEASILAVLGCDALRESGCVPLPSQNKFLAVTDKAGLVETARGLGIAVPAGWAIQRPGDLDDLCFHEPPPPWVVKPSRSVVGDGRFRRKLGVAYADDREALARLVSELPADAFPVLVQERISGTGEGVFLLRWEGRTLAVFAHRRIREKPPSGGVSVYRKSIPADRGLLRDSERLLDAFGWQGVAMAEYKRDDRTGVPYLMEVNARFWGSLQLAIDAGVDFPLLLVSAALDDEPPKPVTIYEEDVRLRWWWGNVDHIIARIKEALDIDGHENRNGPPADRLLGLSTLWRPGDRLEVLRLDDPGPFLAETREWCRQLTAGG